MHPTQRLSRKKNLLLAFDAFGTLYQPNSPIPTQYGRIGLRHGIKCQRGEDITPLKQSFKRAFGEESTANPNYGNATGLGAERWWTNLIRNTYRPFLTPGQEVPQALISELLTRYSTSEGYTMFPDVVPFFQMLRDRTTRASIEPRWKWDRTVVGIITNSDDRVPGILASFGLKIGPRRVGSTSQRSAVASVDDDISFVVLSYDVGYEKPDRRIFDAATEMLKETLDGVEAQSIDDFEKLYVGDSLDKDYFGAEKAGWNAVLVDRRCEVEKLDHESIVSADQDGVAEVEMIRDLGALSRWSPR